MAVLNKEKRNNVQINQSSKIVSLMKRNPCLRKYTLHFFLGTLSWDVTNLNDKLICQHIYDKFRNFHYLLVH